MFAVEGAVHAPDRLPHRRERVCRADSRNAVWHPFALRAQDQIPCRPSILDAQLRNIAFMNPLKQHERLVEGPFAGCLTRAMDAEGDWPRASVIRRVAQQTAGKRVLNR